MLILLTNDDGIYAPGIAALERELQTLGDVVLVAPAVEQSGVGHSITFLSPLVCKEVFEGTPPSRERRRGWAVEGSPADCVKLGIFEFCPRRPDLIVSGINGGLNAGINVLYSGTVAAAIEGAFFGVPSVAVSLEYDEHARFADAARLARSLVEQILRLNAGDASLGGTQLFNINIPTVALAGLPERGPAGVKIVPMGIERYGEHYLKRVDPRGRTYYWATNEPPPKATEHETDLSALAKGFVTVTPLQFDMTRHDKLSAMREWPLQIAD